MRSTSAVVLGSMAVIVAAAPPAAACSPPACGEPFVLPLDVAPANLPAVAWQPQAPFGQLPTLDVLTVTLVRVNLAREATPWASALWYETRVDGAVWRPTGFPATAPAPGGSWQGRGRDRVFAFCSRDDGGRTYGGLVPGIHRVEMRAMLPGLDAPLVAPAVTVDLMCDPPPSPAVAGTDVVAADALGLDADASADASSPPLGRVVGGCTCRAGRTATTTPRTVACSALLALAGLLRCARRRTREP